MKKIALIIFGLLLGFVIFEIFLQFKFLLTQDVDKDINVINELNNIHQYDSVLGWKLKPGSYGRHKTTKGIDVLYKINNQGFRDDVDYQKQKNKKRIIVFGDSFVFGFGVENHNTFPKILEKLTNYEVLNFGVVGYDPGQYFLSLKNEGLSYQPDIVIYGIYLGNDIVDITRDHLFHGDRYKPYFEIENGDLVLKNVPVPQERVQPEEINFRVKNIDIYKKLSWVFKFKTFSLLKNISKWNLYPLLTKFNFVKGITDYDKNFLVLGKILEETQTLIGGKKLIVVIIPLRNIRFDYLEQEFAKKLESISKSKNIDVINPIPFMTRLGSDKFYFLQEGHFNEKGHELMAKLIFEYLNARNLLK